MIEDRKIRKIWTSAINHFWEGKQMPTKWIESTTTMIHKNNKPKIQEHRPIAVTCLESKLVLGYLRAQYYEAKSAKPP